MKILFVVQNYFPSVGGTQIFFQNLAERCVSHYKDEAEVFTTNSYYGSEKKQFRKIEKRAEYINNVKVRRFSFMRGHLYFSRTIKRFFNLFFNGMHEHVRKYFHGPWSPSMLRAINDADADVIMAGTYNYLYTYYPLNRHCYKNPKPFVFQGAIHFPEDESKNGFSNIVLEAIKKSDCYVANTEYEKERLVKLGVSQDKIIVGGISVDMKKFEEGNRNYYRKLFSLQEEDILIGYIGRIEATKSIEVLLKAFIAASGKQKNIRLVIAGHANETYGELLKKKIEAVNKQGNIYFIQGLSEKEKIDLFHAIDLYASSSVNESFGMVFLEAWSCKKPVIGMSIGAIRSVVADGVDGLLSEPGNAEMLSNKILQLCNDKNMRERMGENGFQKTLEHYTWPVVTKRYRDAMLKARENFNYTYRLNHIGT